MAATRQARGRAAARPRGAVRQRSARREHEHRELTGLGLLGVAAFLAVVLWFGWDGGVVGDRVRDVLEILVGQAAVLFPAGLGVVGALLLARSELLEVRPFRSGLAILTFAVLLACGAGRFGIGPAGEAPGSLLDVEQARRYGGLLGGLLGLVSLTLLGGAGTTILAVVALLGGVVLLTGASLGALLRRSGRVTHRVARHTARAARRTARAARAARRTAQAVRAPLEAEDPPRTPAVHAPPVDVERDYADALLPEPEPAAEPGLESSGSLPPLLIDELASREPTPGAGPGAAEAPADGPEEGGAESLFDPPAPARAGEYRLPERSLLRRSRPSAGQPARAAERIAETLVRTLADFGVEATVVGQVAGPRVTRYELQLAPGTKVSKVAQLRDDLAYALATTEIRILAPIPGKQAVGVEVPNVSPNLVTLGDIFDDMPPNASPLAVWLGKDISGQAVFADLARMPHILIAGTTGSGKSGCINTMLCSILLRATPDDVRMILIDPKRVELSFYESIPHLLTPVVSSPKHAAAVLQNLCEEMERRYERMSLAKCRTIAELNRSLDRRREPRLPYLLVVIDELADLMMISPQAVEDAVIRLAQKSRAVGIHLVLATQRPSVDVITGMIKANVPSRIAFAVSSQTDSRVILDQAGAEALLGQGDMLFKPLGTSRLQRIQGAYVSEEEVALIVEACRSQRPQELDESLLAAPETESGAEEDDEELDPDQDPLLAKAIEIVVQTQTASVSLLQRRLRVGYTRAGRLIDMLERRNIISGFEGSKPRRVLVSEADLDRVLALLEEGASLP